MPPEIQALVAKSKKKFDVLSALIEQMPDEDLFHQKSGKWSAAQHLQHLVISTKVSTAAFALPKFLVRLVGGHANTSRSYDHLVSDYQQLLNQGGVATGRYIPREINRETGKKKLLERWSKVSSQYLRVLSQQNKLDSLQKIAVKHPLLGKISLLELAYFTIYHTEHHTKAIS